MPTPKKGPRLGGSASHQRHLLANLATQLFEHGRITTTESRARTLRPVAEKLITKAKRGDLHNRREVLKTIRDKSVVHVLFTEIAPQMAERPGGYTRITKIGNRKGDNAPMAVIELVQEPYRPAETKAGRTPAQTPAQTSAQTSTQGAATTAAPEQPVEEPEAEQAHAGEETSAGAADQTPVEVTADAEDVAPAETEPESEDEPTAE